MTELDPVFTFDERDEFNRRPFAERVIKLLSSDIDTSPMIINGDWGTGKTEFCKKTIELINSNTELNSTAVYVDAFSEDYYDQPLISLLTSIYVALPKEDDKTKLLEGSIKVLKVISKFSLNVIATKLFGEENAKQLADFASAVKNAEDERYESIFKERAELAKTIEAIRNTIQELTSKTKLVLFIDELDRCRPAFALHMLESVKHLFNIKGLKIVFFINKKQLVNAIQHAYGNDENLARRYLDKFFVLQLKLPRYVKEPINARVAESLASVEYFKSLSEAGDSPLVKSPLFDNDRYGWVLKLIVELIDKYELSLRDIEKVIRYLNLYQILFHNDRKLLLGYKLVIVFLIISVIRDASWLDEFKKNPSVFPSLESELQPSRPKLYGKCSIELLSDVMYSEEANGSLFGHNTLSERRNHIRTILMELETFK